MVLPWLSVAVDVLDFLLGVLETPARRRWAEKSRAVVSGYVEAIRTRRCLPFFLFGLAGLLASSLTRRRLPSSHTSSTSAPMPPRSCAAASMRFPKARRRRRKLGLRPWQVFRSFCSSRAIRTMFPALASQFTLLVLATSLVSQIGVRDFFYMATLRDRLGDLPQLGIYGHIHITSAICSRRIVELLYPLVADHQIICAATPA